jgi:hypothetical protein
LLFFGYYAYIFMQTLCDLSCLAAAQPDRRCLIYHAGIHDGGLVWTTMGQSWRAACLGLEQTAGARFQFLFIF